MSTHAPSTAVSRPLRVGFDRHALDSPAGGVRRYVSELMAALPVVAPGIELIAIEAAASLPTNLGRSCTGLPRAARSARLDVFHAPAYTAPPWGVHPLVLTIHDVSYARHPEWYPYRRDPLRRAFYRAAARAADVIITDSDFSRCEIVAAYGIAAERICVVPLGVSDAFRRAADPTGKRAAERAAARPPAPAAPMILHVGDLHPRRNIGVLIDAVAWLRAHHPELASVALTLVGRDAGDAAPLRARARAAGLDPHAVTFVGDADDETLIEWYRRAAVFAYPSRYEGFGLPVLEAMACGVPVVASTAASLPEVAGDAGLLVDPLDTRAWTEALAAVLCSPARTAALRDAGLRRAARFSWTRTAALTLDAYHAARAVAPSGVAGSGVAGSAGTAVRT